jgi:hypothetical protein
MFDGRRDGVGDAGWIEEDKQTAHVVIQRDGNKMKTEMFKFKIGDVILWKGHEATIICFDINRTGDGGVIKNMSYYIVQAKNGTHKIDFSDIEFCERKQETKET